jgi:hypothetical protein
MGSARVLYGLDNKVRVEAQIRSVYARLPPLKDVVRGLLLLKMQI